ncbi:MAG: tetratricopeptide repeat protein [bacterium]|nr:tetratricopeptide repeat protein [bacterium]
MFALKAAGKTCGIYVILMVLLAVVAFGNLGTYDFWDGWDDWDQMADLAMASKDFSYLFSQSRLYDVRPPVDLVFLGGYFLWGEDPAAFHILHIGLHLLASLVVVFVVYRLGLDLELSLLSGLFFLVNVAHFRAVHWMICINYMIALIFGLGAVLCFIRSMEQKRWLGPTVLALGFAMFSHPSSASVVGFCAYLSWRRHGSFRKVWMESWPLGVAVVVFAVLAHHISPPHALEGEGVLSQPDPIRILTNLLWYPGRLITSAHWISRSTSGNEWAFWELGIGGLFLIGTGVMYRKRVFPVADWLVWSVVCILPFLNNRVDRLAFGPSRQLYFASVGTAVALSWILRTLVDRQERMGQSAKRWVFCGLILLWIGFSTYALKNAEALSIYFGARGYAFRADQDRDYGRRAVQLFEQALAHAPGVVPEDTYIRLGTVALLLGKFPTSVFEAGLERNPEALDIQLFLGVAAFLQADEDVRKQGEKRVQKVFEQSTEQETFRHIASLGYHNLGVYYKENQQMSQAELLFRKALFWRPDYFQALGGLGTLLYEENRATEAIVPLQRAVEIRPDHVQTLDLLAQALYASKRMKEAFDVYRKVAQSSPEDADVHNRLGQIAWMIGEAEQARRAFEQAVLIRSDHKESWQNLGNLHYQEGRLDEALQAYQRLVQLDPNHEAGLSNLGQLFYRKGQWDDAIRVLERSARLDSGNIQTHLRLGLSYEQLGMYDAAQTVYRRVLKRHPKQAEAQKRLQGLKSSKPKGRNRVRRTR